MATLINGNGNNAVYAQQDADLYAGALGESTRILNVGSKLAYTIEDANTIAVADGVILTKEGRRVQVDVGSVDEFTIPTGAAGVTRYYIIGYHLYTDGIANQKCETFVQLMASESETIPEAEFREGATEVYVSLYRVKQIGLNLDTITALLSVGIALTDMTDVIGDTDISGIGDGTLTGGLDAVNQNLTELSEDVSEIENKFGWKFLGHPVASTGQQLPNEWNEVMLIGVRNRLDSLIDASMPCIVPYYATTLGQVIIYNHTGSGYPNSGVHTYRIENNVATAAVFSAGSNVSSTSSIWVWYR